MAEFDPESIREALVRNALPIPSNTPYIIATAIMVCVVVLSIVIIAIGRPHDDNTALYVSIIGFGTTSTASLLAYMKSQETHLLVNSRLEQFIRNADRAARSEGELAGREAGQREAGQRIDDLNKPV